MEDYSQSKAIFASLNLYFTENSRWVPQVKQGSNGSKQGLWLIGCLGIRLNFVLFFCNIIQSSLKAIQELKLQGNKITNGDCCDDYFFLV